MRVALLEPQRPAEEYAVTTHARRIIEGARREASRRGETRIGAEHLLLALLADSRTGAVQTLEQCRASPARVERRLEHASEDTPARSLTGAAQRGQLTSRSRPLSTS